MYLQSINWNTFFHELISYPYFWPIVIAIVVLIIVWIQIRKNQKIIELFKNEAGEVSVLQNALNDLIKKISEEVVPESKPNVSICIKKDKLDIKIKVKIYANQNIEEITSLLQQEVNSVLKNTLGVENIHNINILITGFHKEEIRKPHQIPTETEISL